jgi:putative tryptophan/tyrosine transport system substrate-binding protein
VETAAGTLGVQLVILNASSASEIDAGFAEFAGKRTGALLIDDETLFLAQRDQLISLAARYSVPAIYGYREFAAAGGLMSYGPSIGDAFRLAGNYVGRILKGEKPADLPVQQPARFEMVLNLKTSKALGIEVPTITLLRATEVIQ